MHVYKISCFPTLCFLSPVTYFANYVYHISDVGRFPVLDHDRENSSDRRISMPAKGPEHNHNMEVIFALPSMQLHLKTEHLQPSRPVSTGGMHLIMYYCFTHNNAWKVISSGRPCPPIGFKYTHRLYNLFHYCNFFVLGIVCSEYVLKNNVFN